MGLFRKYIADIHIYILDLQIVFRCELGCQCLFLMLKTDMNIVIRMASCVLHIKSAPFIVTILYSDYYISNKHIFNVVCAYQQ